MKIDKKIKVVILAGGDSPEWKISLLSGLNITRGLYESGFQVFFIDTINHDKRIPVFELDDYINKEMEKERYEDEKNLEKLKKSKFWEGADVVFIALHGSWGEGGKIQKILEENNVKFTGSDSKSSYIALHKWRTNKILKSHNFLIPDEICISRNSNLDKHFSKITSLGFPLVVKPESCGSTVGLTLVNNEKEILNAAILAFQYDNKILFQKYIPGEEITVSILNGYNLPPIRIIPESGLYDYEHKYSSGKTKYEVPANISPSASEKVVNLAKKAFNIIGCRHYGRVDFRMTEDEQFYFLEINTIPGMTKTSLVPKSALHIGLSFNDLVSKIIEIALKN